MSKKFPCQLLCRERPRHRLHRTSDIRHRLRAKTSSSPEPTFDVDGDNNRGNAQHHDNAGDKNVHGRLLTLQIQREYDARMDTNRNRTVRIEDDLWDAATAAAKANGENVSVVIRRSLIQYVKENQS